MAQALVISKDLINELRKRGVEAYSNEERFDQAHKRYIQAGVDNISSSSELAIALYKFALRYAATPKLVEGKLVELGIQFKNTSSVYHNICRIAFLDVSENDVSRSKISRYAKVIEEAHKANMTEKQFKLILKNGIANALKRLADAPTAANTENASIGRDIASDYLSQKEYDLGPILLQGVVAEGDEVQLVARYIKGRLKVYGLIPPSVGDTQKMLQKLATNEANVENEKFKLLPDLIKMLSIISLKKGETASVTYHSSNNGIEFSIQTERSAAYFTAPSAFDVFCKTLTLPIDIWRRILETLIPMQKHLNNITCDSKSITVYADEMKIPNIAKWFEGKHKPITIGSPVDTTLYIEVKSEKDHNEINAARPKLLGEYNKKQIENILSFTPAKTYSVLDFSASTPKVTAESEAYENCVNLRKATMRQVKSAIQKMMHWGSTIAFSSTKEKFYLKVQSEPITVVMMFEAE